MKLYIKPVVEIVEMEMEQGILDVSGSTPDTMSINEHEEGLGQL